MRAYRDHPGVAPGWKINRKNDDQTRTNRVCRRQRVDVSLLARGSRNMRSKALAKGAEWNASVVASSLVRVEGLAEELAVVLVRQEGECAGGDNVETGYMGYPSPES